MISEAVVGWPECHRRAGPVCGPARPRHGVHAGGPLPAAALPGANLRGRGDRRADGFPS